MPSKLIFVGWEGTLIERARTGSIDTAAAVRLVRNVVPALRRFIDAGYGCIAAYNAPELAEGVDMADTHAFVTDLLASQGIELRDIRVCRHAPGEDCGCRKPGVGLVTDCLSALDHDSSVAVGDEDLDLLFARNLGIRGFKLDVNRSWDDIAHAVLDAPRQATAERKTRETDIIVSVDLDRAGDAHVTTGIGFFDHMLEQLGKHGGFELGVECRGDLEVDEHHTIEDVALTLGEALRRALGDKRGIHRYGFVVPMDESTAQVQVDLGGRAYLVFEADFPRAEVGGMPTELVEHFFRSVSDSLAAAIHVRVTGENTHHMIEATFKAFARALRMAIAREGSELPSTKGRL